MTYKVAVTLDGRVTLPGSRWISGEESRRLVHELRAASDAVAVGMGTVRADSPRLDARGVEAPRQPRRLAFGKGPLPARFRARAAQRPARRGAGAARLQDGVQSLLLEGGPTLATAFLEAGLVDKLLVFVAPGTERGAGLLWDTGILDVAGLQPARLFRLNLARRDSATTCSTAYLAMSPARHDRSTVDHPLA